MSSPVITDTAAGASMRRSAPRDTVVTSICMQLFERQRLQILDLRVRLFAGAAATGRCHAGDQNHEHLTVCASFIPPQI